MAGGGQLYHASQPWSVPSEAVVTENQTLYTDCTVVTENQTLYTDCTVVTENQTLHTDCTVVTENQTLLRAIKGWDQQFGCYIWAEFRSTFQGVKMYLKLFITIVCSSTLYVYSDVTFSPAHPISWLYQPRLLPILIH